MRPELMTAGLERALRWAAQCHAGQTRRGSSISYFEHIAAVALILAGAGFDEDTIVGGILHDVVEDTPGTLSEVAERFGELVAAHVRHCTEQKTDAQGLKRPWIERKRDHLAALAHASDP